MLQLRQRGLCLPLELNIYFRRHYAYDPSHTPQQLSASEPQQQRTLYQQQAHAMMPPPPPVAHEKANGVFPSNGATRGVSSHARGQLLPGDVGQGQQQSPSEATFMSTLPHHTAPLTSGRFTPRVSTSHAPSGTKSRFIPQTPGSRRFVPAATAAGPRVQSRAGNPDPAPAVHSRQRTPFFPGTRMG